MALVALIGAIETAADDDGGPAGLRALLSIAGQTLIERQAEQLRAQGVERILVQVASIGADLTATFDRIARGGVSIGAIRRPADLAGHVGADDQLILVADGLFAGATLFRTIAEAPAPAVLVTDDVPVTQHLERIDAAHRWAGLAVVPGATVDDLAALPGEWDMVLTLLRTAIQSGARRFSCEPGLFEAGEIAVVAQRALAVPLENRALAQVEYGGMGFGRSLLLMPLVRLAGPWFIRWSGAAAAMAVFTMVAWAGAAGLTVLAKPFAAAIAAIAGCTGLAAMRFVVSFRAETLLVRFARQYGRIMAALLLGLFPWLLHIRDGRLVLPSLELAALSGAAALAVVLSRQLFASLAKFRRFYWLLPDADQAWMVVAMAAGLGLLGPVYAFLLAAMLFQQILWVGYATPPRGPN